MGAGGGGERAAKYLPVDCSILCFADNNTSKQGRKFRGKPVISPKEIPGKNYDLVFIASASFYVQMHQQLIALGVPENKIESVSGDILSYRTEEKLSVFCLIYYFLIFTVIGFAGYIVFS